MGRRCSVSPRTLGKALLGRQMVSRNLKDGEPRRRGRNGDQEASRRWCKFYFLAWVLGTQGFTFPLIKSYKYTSYSHVCLYSRAADNGSGQQCSWHRGTSVGEGPDWGESLVQVDSKSLSPSGHPGGSVR